ncbi:MAG: SDR family NAD(P)-dependent oxidoreductase, partial [Anaerolineae bacterium]
MFDFSNHVVMITGAAGNLGETTARAFHAAGARLVVTDNRQDRLDKVFGDLVDDCLMPAVDITDET